MPTGGHGIARSITARMHGIGGDAIVTTRPGTGTTGRSHPFLPSASAGEWMDRVDGAALDRPGDLDGVYGRGAAGSAIRQTSLVLSPPRWSPPSR
jgi:hypothetical protein